MHIKSTITLQVPNFRFLRPEVYIYIYIYADQRAVLSATTVYHYNENKGLKHLTFISKSRYGNDDC